ncbi:hypothetical protein B0T19DRAFT_477265, partial [Cercophora scortea]
MWCNGDICFPMLISHERVRLHLNPCHTPHLDATTTPKAMASQPQDYNQREGIRIMALRTEIEFAGYEQEKKQEPPTTDADEGETEIEWKAGRQELVILGTMAILNVILALDATVLVPALPA